MAGYRITKQPEGTRVSWWADPRGPDHGVHHWGTIIQHTGDNVFLVWDDDDEFYEIWSASEIRYRIDRGQMRLKQPPKQRRVRLPPDQLVCKTCGRPRQLKCGCPRPGALKPEEWGKPRQKFVSEALTSSSENDTIALSNRGQGEHPPRSPNKERGTMARKTTKAVEAIEDDVEELIELDDAVPAAKAANKDDEGGALSAKEAAALIGTDARTLRKFLRKKNGLVGQGNRWGIDPDDVDALKAEFNAWAKGSKDKAEAKPAKAKAAPPIDDEAFEEIDDDDLEELEV